MTITDVKIRKRFDGEPLKAIVSVTFDNCLAVHDIKIIRANEREIIVMPARKTKDGTFKDIVHPINSELRSALESAVLSEYEKSESKESNTLAETPPAASFTDERSKEL